MTMMMNAEKARALVEARKREEEERREMNLRRFFAEKLEPMIEESAKEGRVAMRYPIASIKQYGEDLLPFVINTLRNNEYKVTEQTKYDSFLIEW